MMTREAERRRRSWGYRMGVLLGLSVRACECAGKGMVVTANAIGEITRNVLDGDEEEPGRTKEPRAREWEAFQ